LAISSPSNGQVLKYNGTSWVNDSDSGITGSLTTNYLPKATGATTLGNSLVYDNGTNVLIGTTTAPTSSDVKILLNSAGGSFVGFGFNGLAGSAIGSTAASNMVFFTATGSLGSESYTERARFDASGNLGLGVTPAAWRNLFNTFQVGYTGALYSLTVANATEQVNLASNYYQNSAGNELRIQAGFATRYQQGSGLHIWSTAASSTAGSGITFTENMRITTLNNLHIGTFSSDSGEKLQVAGTMKVTGASYFSDVVGIGGSSNAFYPLIIYRATAGVGLQVYNSTTYSQIRLQSSGTNQNSYLTFNGTGTGRAIIQVNDTDRLTIDTSGNLGLGVTPSAWRSAYKAFQINPQASLVSSGGNFYLGVNWYQDSGVVNRYIANGPSVFFGSDDGGSYSWRIAPSGTAGNAITFTQAMTLDASGNLGVGATSPQGKLHIAQSSSGIIFSQDGTTATIVGTNAAGTASQGLFLRGFPITFTGNGGGAAEQMRLTALGNLHIGTFSSDSGEKLQVNGTAKITGALTTIGAIITGTNAVYLNSYIRGASTGFIVNNNADTENNFIISDNGNTRVIRGSLTIGSTVGTGTGALFAGAATFSSSVTAKGTLTIGDAGVTNAIINSADGMYFNIDSDASGSTPEFMFGKGRSGAGAGGTTFMTITNAGNVGIGTVNPTTKVHIIDNNPLSLGDSTGSLTIAYESASPAIGMGGGMFLAIPASGGSFFSTYIKSARESADSANSAAALVFGTRINGGSNTERMRITSGGDVGIGMTPSYKLDVTGSARVSDAIAIGTTPDTNNPFKILKNINATVGIKFENTNTSSSAFSAVQLGTDVNGGTKFTNLVYSSSGISASGVYNPDGTSLINNGNGGLNFLGNPIRMYTGGSNGVLRWDLVNDGYITHYSATSPTTSAADSYRQYSADVTAGNAAPHFRTENGAVIKLYQETTAVGNSTISVGGGNAVLDDTEFGGYTLRQVVKALQNQGILA
jgi:hypothetical protein